MKFKIIKYLFIILFVPLLLTSCCFFDYLDEIRLLLEPLQDLNRNYYNKHGNLAKNENVYVAMLKKIGCTNVVSIRKHSSYNSNYLYNGICFGNSYVIGFIVIREEYMHVYVNMHKSTCDFSIETNGVHDSISCKNTGCYHPSH